MKSKTEPEACAVAAGSLAMDETDTDSLATLDCDTHKDGGLFSRRTGKPKKARRKFERSAGRLASAWPCGIVNGFAELIGTESYRTTSYLQV